MVRGCCLVYVMCSLVVVFVIETEIETEIVIVREKLQVALLRTVEDSGLDISSSSTVAAVISTVQGIESATGLIAKLTASDCS